MTHTLTRKADRAIRDYSLPLDGTILAGLSGGSDSMALLHYLLARGCSVEVAHLNHMLRGDEADRDEAFVRRSCEALGVPCHIKRVDIARLSRDRKTGIEETARDERYAFFAEIGELRGITRTALGHTASDNAETVLFNLSRGTGINGLAGIPAMRGKIIRPLIYCTKADVQDYCIKNGIEYIIDSTNLSLDYTRNFIRGQVVPALKHINPSLEDSVSRTSRLLRLDGEYLDRAARSEMLARSITDSIPVELLNSLDIPISSRMVKTVYEDNTGRTLGFDMVFEALELAKDGRTGRSLSLPGGWTYQTSYGVLLLRRNEQPTDYCAYIAHGTEISLADGVSVTFCEDVSPEIVYNLFNYQQIDYGRIIGIVYVRNRRDGDFITLDGHRRTLKKFLIDSKIPRQNRAVWPVFCDDNGPFAFAGMRPDDRVRPIDETKRYMKIKIKGINHDG